MNTDKAASPVPFDVEDWRTWPIPMHYVADGRYCTAWVEGFDAALRMADHFHNHGEWPTEPDNTDGPT